MNEKDKTWFAPQLFIQNGVKDISFYERAFGAVIHYSLTNDDGSIHVAELSIDGALFHLHEETGKGDLFSPLNKNGSTTLIGLFVADVDAFMKQAIEGGAKLVAPAQSYDYGYRQGEVKDPFGHTWMIEMKI